MNSMVLRPWPKTTLIFASATGAGEKLGDFRGQNLRISVILGELTNLTFLSTDAELTKNNFSLMIKLSTMFKSESL